MKSIGEQLVELHKQLETLERQVGQARVHLVEIANTILNQAVPEENTQRYDPHSPATRVRKEKGG